ncbi:prepilin-type N-terminal cleavage/methylation domain-containing protein [Candidatus Fervidibacteria bacterium JGI MDM2 JNZ-1-D12]
MTRRAGLTLMELLVVISILATLAALLFPVYLNARAKIDVISCANQLRQIGLAMHMYANDYGGDTPYFLPSIDIGKHFGIGVSLRSVRGVAAFYPKYIEDKDLLVCPSLRRILPDAVEEAHRLHEERTYQFFGFKEPWASYYIFDPFALDKLAKEDPEGLSLSFAEVFAKRGEQTPIVLCDIHQNGRPDRDNFYLLIPKARFLFPNPSAPLIILRWGGTVDLVYKSDTSTELILMTY